VSIEREIWPLLIASGMYAYVSSGYWLDIGSPRRYLQGSFDLIEGQVETSLVAKMGSDHVSLASSARIEGRVVGAALIGEHCELGHGVHAGSQVILGPGVRVGAGTRLERAVVLDGAQIGEGCVLRDCVVAERAQIGAHTEVSGGAVIGQDAVIGEHNTITAGARISPGVVLGERSVSF
jgi:mannose-1-phosphate guanylyltransferase